MKVAIAIALIMLELIGEGNSCGQPSRNALQDTKGTPLAREQEQDTFASLRPSLAQKTAVPPRLPTFIPFAKKKSRIYPILKSADQSEYDIELGWTRDCNGGNACHYGTVRGSSSELVENGGARVAVKLDRNIQGYFIESTCDVHCDDAAVGWTEGNFHYSISLKSGKKETLIKMANSAI